MISSIAYCCNSILVLSISLVVSTCCIKMQSAFDNLRKLSRSSGYNTNGVSIYANLPVERGLGSGIELEIANGGREAADVKRGIIDAERETVGTSIGTADVDSKAVSIDIAFLLVAQEQL